MRDRGYTLIELSVVIGISAVILFAVTTLQRNVITMNATFQGGLAAQDDARRTFRTMTKDVRIANYADNGAYPIAAATATSVTFYADIDSDGAMERVRYFMSGTTLRRGTIEPTGVPATYPAGNEVVKDLAKNLTNGAGTIFEYYDKNYEGTTATLTSPIALANVRLVKITLTFDKNGTRPPGPQTYTTQVSLRNLKDNL